LRACSLICRLSRSDSERRGGKERGFFARQATLFYQIENFFISGFRAVKRMERGKRKLPHDFFVSMSNCDYLPSLSRPEGGKPTSVLALFRDTAKEKGRGEECFRLFPAGSLPSPEEKGVITMITTCRLAPRIPRLFGGESKEKKRRSACTFTCSIFPGRKKRSGPTCPCGEFRPYLRTGIFALKATHAAPLFHGGPRVVKKGRTPAIRVSIVDFPTLGRRMREEKGKRGGGIPIPASRRDGVYRL